MKPREKIATAEIPGHTGELRCYHHDGAYEVWVDQTQLMSTRVFGSEEALAELALARLGRRAAAHVLVGGLGMGFTLARTLALLDDRAVVEVAELVPEIVAWNRELFGHCAGAPLEDPRARVRIEDVCDVVASSPEAYDVILLDVDNGPEGLSRPGNDQLYSESGLLQLHRALRPEGVLGIWSSADDQTFHARLRAGRFDVELHHVKARRTKGPRRSIWTAKRR
ncbi:MAG: spermidine synthase [Planctomycetota bacterium]|nr:spermidine synthase [Planctomycetota bacterium]